MKVLVAYKDKPAKAYLLCIVAEPLITKIRDLINSKDNRKAMIVTLKDGDIQKAVSHEDIADVEADLILSRRNARWDLKK